MLKQKRNGESVQLHSDRIRWADPSGREQRDPRERRIGHEQLNKQTKPGIVNQSALFTESSLNKQNVHSVLLLFMIIIQIISILTLDPSAVLYRTSMFV